MAIHSGPSSRRGGRSVMRNPSSFSAGSMGTPGLLSSPAILCRQPPDDGIVVLEPLQGAERRQRRLAGEDAGGHRADIGDRNGIQLRQFFIDVENGAEID